LDALIPDVVEPKPHPIRAFAPPVPTPDAVPATVVVEPEMDRPANGTSSAPITADAAQKSRRVRSTFHVSAELLSALRDATVHLSGPPLRLTLSDVVESAFRREIERLAREYNNGDPFPARQGELRGGRQIF
jgi:hypothetical protein